MGEKEAEESRGRESMGAGQIPKRIKTQKAAICTLTDCKVGMRKGAGLGVDMSRWYLTCDWCCRNPLME